MNMLLLMSVLLYMLLVECVEAGTGGSVSEMDI